MKHNPFITKEQAKKPIRYWLKTNLFSSVLNTVLTILSAIAMYLVFVNGLLPLLSLDWTVIRANLKLIFVGSYPGDQLWRIWLLMCYVFSFVGATTQLFLGDKKSKLIIGLAVIFALLGLAPFGFTMTSRIFMLVIAVLLPTSFFGARYLARSRLTQLCIAGWVLLMPVCFSVVQGFGVLLPVVKTNYWGGLLLSLLISVTSIFLCLPIGLLLALGRRSSMRFVSTVCTVFIEVVRGVPLITILFIGYLILPMALPASWTPSVFIRALVGVIMFHSAYMAEAFRGGLQGISVTQYEAAKSLNIGPAKTMILIILPQVLKRMIPILVNAFTSALKDTSLISIIGMLDLIGISTSIVSNPKYLTGSAQVLFFEGLIYFVLCYSISKGSAFLEKRLGVSTRVGL